MGNWKGYNEFRLAKIETAPMPSTGKSTKTIQATAKLFNKLVSGLNADLNEAVRKIEKLRREVQNIKTTLGRANESIGSSGRKSNDSGRTSKRATETSRTAGHPERQKGAREPSRTDPENPSFVFPREPFNPSSTSEPSPSGNN